MHKYKKECIHLRTTFKVVFWWVYVVLNVYSFTIVLFSCFCFAYVAFLFRINSNFILIKKKISKSWTNWYLRNFNVVLYVMNTLRRLMAEEVIYATSISKKWVQTVGRITMNISQTLSTNLLHSFQILLIVLIYDFIQGDYLTLFLCNI